MAMATSGSTTVNVAATRGGSYTDGVRMRLSWAEQSQSVTSNTTTVRFTLQIITGQYGQMIGSATQTWKISCAGKSKSGNFTIQQGNNVTRTLGTFDVTISHNANGSGSFSASFSATFNMTFAGKWISSKSGTLSGTLDTIPRVSTPTVSGVLQLGNAITINTNRASPSFTHTLSYSWAGHTGTIATGVGASTTWTPATATFAPWLTNSSSATCTITCVTYSGSTTIGTTTTNFSLAIPSSVVPTLTSATFSDTEGYLSTYGAFVQRMSRASVAIVAAGVYGSTITGYDASFANYIGNYEASSTVNLGHCLDSGSVTVYIEAQDSRGRVIRGTRTITVASYAAPSISASAKRVNASTGAEDDESNTARLTISGSVHDVNSKGLNAGTVKVYVKQDGTSSYPTSPAYSANRGESWSFTWDTTLATNSKGYSFLVSVTDSFGETVSTECSVGYATPVLDFRDGGGGIGIGHISDRDGLVVGFPSAFEEDMTITGSVLGFRGTGYVSSGYRWIEIARADMDYKNAENAGFIRVLGNIGAYGVAQPVDVTVPLRSYSVSSVMVATPYLTQERTDLVDIVAILDKDMGNRVRVFLKLSKYYNFNIIVSSYQATVLFADSGDPFGGAQPDPDDPTFYLSEASRHVYLPNNSALAALTTSGGVSALLRMNTSNQVELTWTSGGLRGRCFKKIWSGNASPGSTITVSELPYYNLFVFEQSYNSAVILVNRMKGLNSSSYTGIGGYSSGGRTLTFFAVQCQDSGSPTRLEITYASRGYLASTSEGNINITGIYGLL